MEQKPSTVGRWRGLLFVLALAALILGMGVFFAAGILRERTRATPKDGTVGGGATAIEPADKTTGRPEPQPR